MRKTISKWGVCYWCGTTDGPFEADHVFPASLMEEDDIRNLVCSCRKCNREKGNKPVGVLSLNPEPEFRHRDLEISRKVFDYYYDESLKRYKKLAPRGHKLFMAKKRWDCKPAIRLMEKQALDDDYYLKIEFLKRTIEGLKCTIDGLECTIEDLKTIWEKRFGR